MNGPTVFNGVFFICSLAFFFGIFFGLMYPEIDTNETYQAASCTVTSKTILSNYCAQKSCSYCDSFSGITCSNLINSESQKSPEQCALNASMCAVGGDCNNGYKCCHTCCSTCTSCSKNSCRSYPCNCFCCSSTSHLRCTVVFNVCYTTRIFVDFLNHDGDNISSYGDISVGTNLGRAIEIENYYNISQEYYCYYNPGTNEVRFSVGYSTSTLGWTGFACVILMLSLMSITWEIISRLFDHLTYFTGLKGLIATVWLWIGYVIPLIIMLPIASAPTISYETKNNLVIAALCMFFIIGFAPTMIYFIKLSRMCQRNIDKVYTVKQPTILNQTDKPPTYEETITGSFELQTTSEL